MIGFGERPFLLYKAQGNTGEFNTTHTLLGATWGYPGGKEDLMVTHDAEGRM